VQLGYGTCVWLSVSKLPLKCAVVSLYSVVKHRLKCNTGRVCNRLIQFLLNMVLSMEEHVFVSAHLLSKHTVEYSVLVHVYLRLTAFGTSTPPNFECSRNFELPLILILTDVLQAASSL
jgi:hypothetical protein